MKTTKLTYCLIAVLCISQLVMAQDKFRIGINIGGTYSSLRGNPVAEENKAALDILFGASFELPLKDRLSLKMDINFESKRVTNEFSNLGGFDPLLETSSLSLSLNYVAIPVMLKYRFGKDQRFFVNGGPYYAAFRNVKTKVDGNTVDDNESDSLFQNSDFGISAGIGMSFPVNDNSTINLELRNNLGLNNISKVEIVDDGSLKTNSLNLILNWDFGL
ncbi:porin family protein [Ichthyenterobacterium sp. W332]|uniref:Porin family protein n=1 Tax=Microcosmobacter mediterraneus TaxID=3075607 RepID=A0ABU2YHE3_9FLAO|nr:porin family protein [Ichthyenterobacterium sp. W332]MDT0557205.1 porin family protein [Ichthyenterobacterium sp. W332]